MKRNWLLLLIAVGMLNLAACSNFDEASEEVPSAEPSEVYPSSAINITEEDDASSEIYEADGLEAQIWNSMTKNEALTDEQRSSLNEFAPIFFEQEKFVVYAFAEDNLGMADFSSVANLIFDCDDLQFESLYQFTLVDMTNDKNDELVMLFKEGGYSYLIIHKEGDEYFCNYYPIRWAIEISDNGNFCASGGSGDETYYHLCFDGGFTHEKLAWQGIDENNEFIGEIAGETVDQSTFQQWLGEHFTCNLSWFEPVEY